MIHIFISHTPERVRRGATGYAIPGYQATVLDEDGKPCAPGKVGRLAVKGPTGCRYLADERQKRLRAERLERHRRRLPDGRATATSSTRRAPTT